MGCGHSGVGRCMEGCRYPKADNTDVPETAEEITLEFLQEHWSADIEGFEILPVMAETRPGVEKPDGGGASGPAIKRLKLRWSAGGGVAARPATSLVKVSNHQTEHQQPMIMRLIFSLARFYFPELNANELLWYGHNCKAAVANGYSMPKCYAAVATHEEVRRPNDLEFVLCDRRVPFRTLLVLEDAGAEFKSPPQAADLPEEWCRRALCNAARLHASYWGRYDAATNPELRTASESPIEDCIWHQNLMLAANTSGTMINTPLLTFHDGTIIEGAVKEWTNKPEATELWQRFCGCGSKLEYPEIVAAFEAVRNKLKDKEVRDRLFDQLEPQTLCHGDIHGWNHMFPKSEDYRGPQMVYAVDFQMVGRGRATWDLAYFYSFSVPPNYDGDMRLLKAYHDELLRVGKTNPKFDPAEVEFEAFKTEFVRNMVMVSMVNVRYLPDVFTTKEIAAMAERGEKSETEAYQTMRLWKRVFERIANYHKQGVIDQI